MNIVNIIRNPQIGAQSPAVTIMPPRTMVPPPRITFSKLLERTKAGDACCKREIADLPLAAQIFLKTSLQNIVKRLQQSSPEIAEEISKKMDDPVIRYRYEKELSASLYEYLHKRMLGRIAAQNPSCSMYGQISHHKQSLQRLESSIAKGVFNNQPHTYYGREHHLRILSLGEIKCPSISSSQPVVVDERKEDWPRAGGNSQEQVDFWSSIDDHVAALVTQVAPGAQAVPLQLQQPSRISPPRPVQGSWLNNIPEVASRRTAPIHSSRSPLRVNPPIGTHVNSFIQLGENSARQPTNFRPWVDMGYRLPVSNLDMQGVTAAGRQMIQSARMYVANFAHQQYPEYLLSTAIRDEYGHLDEQIEHAELAKILHRWTTEQNPKIALEAARQRHYHEWSEAVWGGLDRIDIPVPDKKAMREYISPSAAAASSSRITAAQVVKTLNAEHLDTFATALTSTVEVPLRGWLQQSATEIICALGRRLHNLSAGEGGVLLAKMLILLLPAPPLQRMIEEDPELSTSEYKIKRSIIFLMEKANDRGLLDWGLYMVGAARAGVHSIPGVTPRLCSLGCNSSDLLEYVPHLYQDAAVACIKHVEREWLLDTVLQRVAEPEKVLKALFRKTSARTWLTTDWVKQVSVIKTLCRVIIERLRIRKNHRLQQLASMMVDWLPCIQSRSLAAACFWAHEAMHTNYWVNKLDLATLEDSSLTEYARYDTHAAYKQRIMSELQGRVPPISFAERVVDGLKCITDNVAKWLLPVAYDLLRKNLDKCSTSTLRVMSTWHNSNSSDAELLWSLLARGSKSMLTCELIALAETFDPSNSVHHRALAGYGEIFVGEVPTAALYRMLDTLSGTERKLLLESVDLVRYSIASTISIAKMKLLEEYLDRELSCPDIKLPYNIFAHMLKFIGDCVIREKIVNAMLRCSAADSISIVPDAILRTSWLALIAAHRGDLIQATQYRNSASISWDGSSPLSVVLRNIALAKNSTWTIAHPGAVDAGGVRREFYSSAGDEIREHHLEPLDGYSMPRSDAHLADMRAAGIVMARAVEIDKCMLGLEMHPAVLAAITLSQFGRMFWTGRCDLPWAATAELLSENWCRLLAPESWESQKAAPGNSNIFAAEFLAHYSDRLYSIASLVDGWHHVLGDKVYPPQQLDTLLRGDRSCDVVGLDRILIAVDGVRCAGVSEEVREDYRASFLSILRKWSLEKRRKLYRFWFGSEQPNKDNGATIVIVRMDGLARAYGHTCGGLLKLAWVEGYGNRDALAVEIEAMLDRSLENQRLAREAGQVFQLA
jgi:hypothetical protein